MKLQGEESNGRFMNMSEISSELILVLVFLFFFFLVKVPGLTLGYLFCHHNFGCIHPSLFHIGLKHLKSNLFLVLSNSTVHQFNILICHRTLNMYS